MRFIGTIKGEFEERQSVEAENLEEAKKMLSENLGETIEHTATGILEVTDIQEE